MRRRRREAKIEARWPSSSGRPSFHSCLLSRVRKALGEVVARVDALGEGAAARRAIISNAPALAPKCGAVPVVDRSDRDAPGVAVAFRVVADEGLVTALQPVLTLAIAYAALAWNGEGLSAVGSLR